MTVDDDPGVSRAVARDLRRRYGDDYRIVRAESGAAGARGAARDEAARRAGRGAARRLPDAADERHRVPRAGDGPLPVRRAGCCSPPTPTPTRRSTRSTSSTSTTTCSSRGTRRRRSSTRSSTSCSRPGAPATTGRCRRPRWSATAGRRGPREVRDFLARNQVPYRWYSADEPGGARGCWPRPGTDGQRLPVVITPDGERAGRADGRRAGRAGRAWRPTPTGGLLRPGRGRRRPGRAGRRGVRRVGGAAHGAGRAHRDRRAGRAELPDRELPRLPRRRLRRAAHRAGPAAGGRSSAPRCSPPATWSALEVNGSARTVRFADGGTIAAHTRDPGDRRVLPAARGAGRSTSSPAAACSTARR